MLLPGKLLKTLALLLLIILNLSAILVGNCIAQELKEKDEAFHPYHLVGLAFTHSHVFDGRDEDGNKKALSMPSLSIDYSYFFNRKWGFGLHTDIVLEEFKVEKSGDNEEIERSYPIAPALMGIFKPTEHWCFLLGMGGEFSREENFVLTRAGVEYSAELPKEWEVFGTLSYDFKWNAYDTWGIGIGVAKKFGKKNHEEN